MESNIKNTRYPNLTTTPTFRLFANGPMFPTSYLGCMRDILGWTCEQSAYSCHVDCPYRFELDNCVDTFVLAVIAHPDNTLFQETLDFVREHFFPCVEIPALEQSVRP